MTAMETLAHRFECPRCGAAAGALCMDVRPVLHVERYDVARASVIAEHGPQMPRGRAPQPRGAYASLYPGVDCLPTRLPRIDRYGHAWCWCCDANGQAVGGDGYCDACRARHSCGHPARYGHGVRVWECRCGQQMTVRIEPGAPIPPRVCGACLELERAPQGETVRLFTPAPAQLEGQLSF